MRTFDTNEAIELHSRCLALAIRKTEHHAAIPRILTTNDFRNDSNISEVELVERFSANHIDTLRQSLNFTANKPSIPSSRSDAPNELAAIVRLDNVVRNLLDVLNASTNF